ncbi:MAG: HAD family phosphatase [Anaerolineae bacterium]|nr:HAD family phosphatase [Anaerolineae bacterium]
MIKGLIFDFGGVIMRTEDPGPRLAWDQRLGLPPGSVERAVHQSDIWVQVQLGRISNDAYWKGVAELLYTTPDNMDDLRRDYFSGDRLNDDLIDLIRALKEQGYPVVLLSNDSLQLEAKLRELDINTLFDQVLISAKIGVMKPDPTAYRVALRALKIAPFEAVCIDDLAANIHSAEALGIHAILYRPETDIQAELLRLFETTAG